MTWSIAFENEKFKKKFIVGLITVLTTLTLFSFFLNYIEQREGVVLNDFVLNYLPSKDCSIPIFSTIWICAALALFSCFKNPEEMGLLFWSYTFLLISRVISIGLVKLNPPNNLIPMVDPLVNFFYGGKFLTKDLFYSGHTSTIFMLGLIVQKKLFKYIILSGSIAIGIMVLFQHVHYTIDVVAAPFFAYLIVLLGKKVAKI